MKKNKKIILLIFILIITIFLIGYFTLFFTNRNKVAILAYHGIMPRNINTSKDNLIVDQEKFEQELKLIKKMGYDTMTLDEFNSWKKNKVKNGKKVLITFDDGWKNNYEYAFSLLKKYDMNATVFYIGGNCNGSNPNFLTIEEVNKIKKDYPNIEFASHSYGLHYHSNKTYEIVDKDIKIMKDILDSKYFAYPYGDYNDEYIKALKDNGFNLAFTFGPGKEHRKASLKDDDYKIPRLNISNDMPIYKFILRVILPL